MSRNVYRLNNPVKRPTLSWSSAPQARETLVALTHWLFNGKRAEAVQIGAGSLTTADEQESSPQNGEALHRLTTEGQRPYARQPHLKVVMVRDALNPQAHTPARLVISGRMADVCAELDRLAA